MKTKTLVALLSCIVLALSIYVTPSASAASDEEEVLQVLSNWTKAMNTADFDLWCSVHWNSPKSSCFAPPKSSAFLTQGYDEITKNMKSVFEYPKGTYVSSMHNPQVTMLEDNIALITVYSIMTISPPAVTEQIVEQQRVTFVVQKIGGKWVIVHDHGSYLPVE